MLLPLKYTLTELDSSAPWTALISWNCGSAPWTALLVSVKICWFDLSNIMKSRKKLGQEDEDDAQ